MSPVCPATWTSTSGGPARDRWEPPCQHDDVTSLNLGGRWCPECGAEYRPGFTECPDCRAALTDQKPDHPGGQPEDPHERDPLVYDLAGLSGDQRRGLRLLLVTEVIVHEWRDDSVVVPRAKQDEVDDLVELVRAQDDTASRPDLARPDLARPDPEQSEPASPMEDAEEATEHDDGALPLAGPGQRLVGALVDSVVLGLLLWVSRAAFTPGPSKWASAFTLALGAAYEIVGVALWGRTVGKVVARTRVVMLDDRSIPGVAGATRRWVVPAAFGLLALALPSDGSVARAVFLLGPVWGAVVFLGVLSNRRRQGLHDRAAGTVVLTAQS